MDTKQEAIIPSISNQQKYENYKEQFKRLNRALSNGFNLEAMFIEYALMEDRTESILLHAEKWDAYIKSRHGHGYTIDSKVKYIKKLAENKKDILHKYFSDDLLDSILQWKEDRNRLIHALLKQNFAHNEIADLALRGKKLTDTLRNKSGNYNRAVAKAKAQVDK